MGPYAPWRLLQLGLIPCRSRGASLRGRVLAAAWTAGRGENKMAKLTKKQLSALRQVEMALERGALFLREDRTAVMRSTSMGSADVFTAPYYPGKSYASIQKEAGSDLVGVFSALEYLRDFLEQAGYARKITVRRK